MYSNSRNKIKEGRKEGNLISIKIKIKHNKVRQKSQTVAQEDKRRRAAKPHQDLFSSDKLYKK